MARRSYLQRIAAPLTPGEPVLFSVPGPAIAEARPAAPAAKIFSPQAAGAAAGAGPTIRRKPMPRPEFLDAAAEQKPAPVVADDTAPPREMTIVPGPPLQTTAFQAATPENWTAVPPTGAEPANTAPAQAAPAFLSPDGAASDVSKISPWPAARPPEAFDEVPLPPPAALHPIAMAIPPDQNTRAAQPPAERIPAAARPLPPLAEQKTVWAEPHPAAPHPAAPRSAAPWSLEPAAAPRIHIGTIEIRTTQPPAPPPPDAAPAAPAAAPRAALTAPPRGYGWRYGLIQG